MPARLQPPNLLARSANGKGKLPTPVEAAKAKLDPPPFTGTEQQVARGASIYGRSCFACHGGSAVGGTIAPDLRHSPLLADPKAMQAVLIDGALKHNGMVSFKAVISTDDAEAIRQYLIKRANDDKAQ